MILEAKNVLKTAQERVEAKILSQSTKIDPVIVSYASNINKILDTVNRVIDVISNSLSENIDIGRLVKLDNYLYVSLYSDGFVITRGKPYHIMLSYNKGDGRIYIRTRKLTAHIDGKNLFINHLAIKASIEIDEPDSYKPKLNEMKYLLKKLNHVVENYLVQILARKLKPRT